MLLLLAACQEPFPEDRHDLSDFRLAGLAVERGEFRVLAWSGYGAWHRAPPTVRWTVDGRAVTAAPAAPFCADVEVEDEDGHREAGELCLDAAADTPEIRGFTRTLTGSGAELALDVGSPATTHWMAPAGEFSESGPHATTWAGDAGSIAIGLTFDGHGGNAWTVIDLPRTLPPPYLAVGGRVLPISESLQGEGWYTATLAADDALAGVRLVDVQPATGPGDGEAACGADGLDLDALVEGRCGRDALLGARVAIFATAVQ